MGARTWMTIFRTSTRRSANFIPSPANAAEWTAYRISDEQVEFFDTFGYLAGIPMLTPEQVEVLRDDLAALTQPSHPGHRLFYEYNSNESADPSRVLFHALGAWRITPGFHDLLVEPGVSRSRRRSSCAAASVSGTTSCFRSPPVTAAWSPGTRTTPTGLARSRCRT